jgi:hypothetical protein
MIYNFPQLFRPASLEERKIFYEKEFKVTDAVKWLENFSPYHMSITFDLGVESGIIKDKSWITNSFIRLGPIGYGTLREVLLKFLPEDVYYDRNLYSSGARCNQCEARRNQGCFECEHADGQQLVFDVDPENYMCPHCDTDGEHRYFSFCEKCFRATREATLYLYEILSESFSDLRIVSTGRGFHIHVFDKDSFGLSLSERKSLISRIRESHIAVDSHITTGKMYLIRLPYTLNGLVSRFAVPLNREKVESLEIDSILPMPEYMQEEVADSNEG